MTKTDISQEALKEKYEHYLKGSNALHQRARMYDELWSEDIKTLGFLLTEIQDDRHDSGRGNLGGLQPTIQAILSEKQALRQNELTQQLDATAKRLTIVGIAVALAGAAATIVGLFKG